MSTPGIREVVNGNQATTAATFTVATGAGTAVGDLLIIAHLNDFYALSNISAPSCTGSPTMNAITNGVADGGTNEAHIKTYWCVVNTAGANTVTFTETGTHDEEKAGAIFVLTGANTSNPIDDAAGAASATGSATVPAPSVSPTTPDALLICLACSGAGVNETSWTPPTGMSEQFDVSFNSAMGYTGATVGLTSSGATGAKNFTPAGSTPYGTVSIAVRGAAPVPLIVPPTGLMRSYTW